MRHRACARVINEGMVAPVLASTPSQIATSCRAQPIVYDGVLPELCPVLEQVILGRMQVDRGRRTGSINVGGWKSGEDFFQWSDPAVQQLRQTIADMLGARSPVAWAMVNRAGSHHPRHQHRVAVLTGIYYVTAGSQEAITPTVFECEDGDLEVEPYPGRIAILRGDMWHRVPIYPGDLPRITIAFDVRR
jgi:Putative 2OG-Fe(II) oxygenase